MPTVTAPETAAPTKQCAINPAASIAHDLGEDARQIRLKEAAAIRQRYASLSRPSGVAAQDAAAVAEVLDGLARNADPLGARCASAALAGAGDPLQAAALAELEASLQELKDAQLQAAARMASLDAGQLASMPPHEVVGRASRMVAAEETAWCQAAGEVGGWFQRRDEIDRARTRLLRLMHVGTAVSGVSVAGHAPEPEARYTLRAELARLEARRIQDAEMIVKGALLSGRHMTPARADLLSWHWEVLRPLALLEAADRIVSASPGPDGGWRALDEQARIVRAALDAATRAIPL